MLSETLKEETKDLHVALEKVMVPMIKNIRGNQDYVKVLELFYSYFGALERKISKLEPLELPDYHQRRKKEAIAEDIVSLGGTVPELAPDQHLPELANQLQVWGALYVMEGSTLGGIHISKMIAKLLNLKSGTSLAFFDGYGDQTNSMWNSFRAALDEQVATPEEKAVVIQSANETFLEFKRWIELKQAA